MYDIRAYKYNLSATYIFAKCISGEYMINMYICCEYTSIYDKVTGKLIKQHCLPLCLEYIYDIYICGQIYIRQLLRIASMGPQGPQR